MNEKGHATSLLLGTSIIPLHHIQPATRANQISYPLLKSLPWLFGNFDCDFFVRVVVNSMLHLSACVKYVHIRIYMCEHMHETRNCIRTMYQQLYVTTCEIHVFHVFTCTLNC